MADIDTVMSWLEGLTEDNWRDFHSDSEVSNIAKAALELLKEHQQIVRCKDCKHRGDRNKCIVAFVAEKQEMPYFFYDNRGEWFCADGERVDT